MSQDKTDQIEAMRAENARLRAALERIADVMSPLEYQNVSYTALELRLIAKEALGGS